jgi:hypothetical protein
MIVSPNLKLYGPAELESKLVATLVLATLEMGLASPLGLLGPTATARLLDQIGLEECIHL